MPNDYLTRWQIAWMSDLIGRVLTIIEVIGVLIILYALVCCALVGSECKRPTRDDSRRADDPDEMADWRPDLLRDASPLQDWATWAKVGRPAPRDTADANRLNDEPTSPRRWPQAGEAD